MAKPRKHRVIRPKRPSPWLKAIAKGTVIGISLAVGSLILWAFVNKASHPFLLEYRQRTEIRDLKAKIAAEETKIKDCYSRIAFLRSDDGIEYEARKRGAARPGEILIQLPRSLPQHEAMEPEPKPPPKTWKDRLLEWLPGKSGAKTTSQSNHKST